MIEFRVLGRAELQDGDRGQLESILKQPKRLAILAYLCLAGRGGFVRRDELIALFWPESDAERARAALNQSLYVLRRTLGSDAIPGRGAEEVGVSALQLRCDAAEFLNRLDEDDLAAALDLYSGDLLPALCLDSPEADRWLDEMRADLRGLALKAARNLGTEAQARGDVDLACERNRRALEIAPESESAARGLVESLWHGGRRTEALEAFERFETRLSSEYGVGPGDEFRELVERIRHGSQGQRQEPTPGGSVGQESQLQPPADSYLTADDVAQALSERDERRRQAAGGRRRVVASLALTVVAALALVYALVGRAGVDRAPLRLAVLPFDASGAELPDTVYAEILFADVIDRLVGSGAHLISAVATDR